MQVKQRVSARLLLATVGASVLVPLAAAPASAGASSTYGEWGPGRVVVPALGFPAATVSTDATNASVPSGRSAFLNPTTPFGAAYGSSQGHSYLLVNTASGRTPSTTTLRFARPTPVGWGFALGDVDADKVQVSATGADGHALTVAELGFRGSFNFCNGASPRPSACPAPSTDLPTWDPGTATLVGSGTDTNGASGWLRPTVPVASLSLRFTAITGIPVYQLWLATETTRISGRVSAACGSADGTTLELLDAKGRPVLDQQGRPVTETAAADGTYAFDRVAPGRYQVRLQVPSGYLVHPDSRAADTAADDNVPGVDFTMTCPVPVVEPPVSIPPTGHQVDIPVLPVFPPDRPVVVVDPPAHGTVTERRPGVLTYTPKPGFVGTDSFVYQGVTKAGKAMAVRVTVHVPARASRDHDRAELPDTGAQDTPWLLGAAAALVLSGAVAFTVARTRRR